MATFIISSYILMSIILFIDNIQEKHTIYGEIHEKNVKDALIEGFLTIPTVLVLFVVGAVLATLTAGLLIMLKLFQIVE